MVARRAQEGMDAFRPALAVPRLPGTAHESAPAPPARLHGRRARQHYQACRCSHAAAQLCHPSSANSRSCRRSSAAERRRWAGMSHAVRTARTCASLTPPAAIGIAQSARPLLPKNGWPTAKPISCPCRISMSSSPCPDRSPISPITTRRSCMTCCPKTPAEPLVTTAADPKHLGARIGLTAVLHTWGSALTHHPHAHIILPGGGLSPNGQHWIAGRLGFFLSVRVLSRLFRRLFLARVTAAYHTGRLPFFADHAGLAEPARFKAYVAALRKVEWVAARDDDMGVRMVGQC